MRTLARDVPQQPTSGILPESLSWKPMRGSQGSRAPQHGYPLAVGSLRILLCISCRSCKALRRGAGSCRRPVAVPDEAMYLGGHCLRIVSRPAPCCFLISKASPRGAPVSLPKRCVAEPPRSRWGPIAVPSVRLHRGFDAAVLVRRKRALASSYASQVFSTIEAYFNLFDAMARKLGVFKVDTIGDA